MPVGDVPVRSRRASIGLASALFAVGLVGSLSACGGAEDGLALAVSALGVDAATVLLDVHPSDRPCVEIRDSGPGVRGSYAIEIPVAAGEASQTTELSELRPATYTLALWALDGARSPIAYGCADDVTIRDGRRTRVAITLVPYSN